jgi:two-component system LytT family response regulator
MKRISSLIIDDERLARVTLIQKLSMFPEIEVIGEASSISTAVKAVNELKPDLLFLDIQLADGNGFDLLDRIDFTGKIVFVTAFDEFACRAFEINALDYLLKPVSKERLKSVINRILNSESESVVNDYMKFRYNDRIMIEQKKSIHFINIDSIICIKADRDYTVLHENGGKEYLVLKSIGDWQKKLPDEHFARVHRNSIINFNYIERADKFVNTAKIFLKSIAEPINVSRGYYKMLKTRYFYK